MSKQKDATICKLHLPIDGQRCATCHLHHTLEIENNASHF